MAEKGSMYTGIYGIHEVFGIGICMPITNNIVGVEIFDDAGS